MKNLLAYAFNNICVFAIGLSFYLYPSTSMAQDMLDDAAEVQYQQAVNDVLSTYDPQITQINSQLQNLSTAGKQQCIQATREAQSAADAQAGAAGAQAMQGMIGPAAETAGHAIEAVMAGAGGEKKSLEEQRKSTKDSCNAPESLLSCTNTTAEPDRGKIAKYCEGQSADATTQSRCKMETYRDNQPEATRVQTQLTELNKELDEVSSGMNELLGSGLQLAAAGFTGNMVKKQTLEQAAGIKANAAEQEKLCDLQVNNQIQALQGQLANLQAQKARDLMMARMSAEYGTRERRKAADLLNTDDEDDTDLGNIAVNEPDFIAPDAPADFSSLFGNNGSGSGSGGGGGGPAGGAAGAGGGDPQWVFDGGGSGGAAGGSPLPPSAADGSWSGQGTEALTGAGDGGGFGKGFSDFAANDKAETEERTPASVGGIGDGGIRVLLARSSIIHSKHASTLMKSIDLDKLANRKKEDGRAAASVTNSLK